MTPKISHLRKWSVGAMNWTERRFWGILIFCVQKFVDPKSETEELQETAGSNSQRQGMAESVIYVEF